MSEEAGHNQPLSASSEAAQHLKSFVSRIENVQSKIDDLNQDKREIYAEAKAVGLCKNTLRKVVNRRRRDRSEVKETDQLLELYEAILFTLESGEKQGVDPLS